MTTTSDPKFSYEFFPPRTPNMQRRLWRAVGQLERLDPEFFSMTFGALGSAQQVSIESAIAMHQESPVPIAAHLTTVGMTAARVIQVARDFRAAGIRRIVALRGDAAASVSEPGIAFGYHSAVELVEALVAADDFDISVAAYPETHPEAASARADLQHLRRKLDAGARRAITQYFFDADVYLRFRDRARLAGIDQPIIPGILPIHDFARVVDFSRRCGASVPPGYAALFDKVKNCDEAQYRLGLELAVGLCQRLISEGVNQFHLYTLNQTDMCLDISLALGASVGARRVSAAA